jgi:NADH-quinone oxidoreductase subunit N
MNALIFSALSGVIMMFSSFLLKNKSAMRTLAHVLLLAVIIVNVMELRGVGLFHIDTKGMLTFDRFALLFSLVANVCTLAFFLLSSKDMERVGVNYGDYFALLFFILSGVVIASSFSSLLMLFLGIEIISIPLYILTGSDKRNLKSNEASLKYFLMGAFSTGLMLMGIALIYGATGTFQTGYYFAEGKEPVLLVAGMMLLLFSMSFKVSAAPFHFWTPDVYDGAPTVFTSFMATIVKAAGFIAFMRLFNSEFNHMQPQWKLMVGIIAAATLFIGNITAVFQQSVKRMLAYSSISQAGFMMLAVYSLKRRCQRRLDLICSGVFTGYYWNLCRVGKNEGLYIRRLQRVCPAASGCCGNDGCFPAFTGRHSIDCGLYVQILYAEGNDRWRQFMAGHFCGDHGGCERVLLFPVDPGHVL